MIGHTGHTYVEHNDDRDAAAWMLGLLDASPDKLAIITVPDPGDDVKRDELDERLVRIFDLAKLERPDLGVRMLPVAFNGERAPLTALMIQLHEHEWIGGGCIRGCGETRPAA